MTERLADRLELQDLNARYAHALDHNDLPEFLSVFTPEAVYSLGARESRGHAELAQFFTGRQAQGVRTTRHLFSGLTIAFQDGGRATATSVWMSFAGTGALPLSPAVPFLVADMHDSYLLVDGRWLICERRIAPVFRSAGDAPAAGARQ